MKKDCLLDHLQDIVECAVIKQPNGKLDAYSNLILMTVKISKLIKLISNETNQE